MSQVWLTELADVLRAAGVPVIEESYALGRYKGRSWKQVGFGGQGLTSFSFILWHHDASSVGDSPGALDWMKYWARDGAVDVTPAAAVWVCSGCHGKHASGTWHVYAAGLSNHAGRGCNGWGVGGSMNAHSLGIETDHTFGESWEGDRKQAQLSSLRLGTAAIFVAYNLNPTPALLLHKTWTDGGVDGVPFAKWTYEGGTRGRKNDIDGLNLLQERQTVLGLMRAIQKPISPQEKRIAKTLRKIKRARKRVALARAAGQPFRDLRQAVKALREKLARQRAKSQA